MPPDETGLQQLIRAQFGQVATATLHAETLLTPPHCNSVATRIVKHFDRKQCPLQNRSNCLKY